MIQWLVMNANITESEWNGITIKRGQVVTSLSKLSEGVQQSIQQTRNTLDNIVSNKEVTKKTTRTYTIITICNFDDYVGLNFYDNKEENKEATQSATQFGTKNQHSEQQQIRDIIENKDIEITSRTDVLEEAEIVTESINNPGRDYKRARARKSQKPRMRLLGATASTFTCNHAGKHGADGRRTRNGWRKGSASIQGSTSLSPSKRHARSIGQRKPDGCTRKREGERR